MTPSISSLRTRQKMGQDEAENDGEIRFTRAACHVLYLPPSLRDEICGSNGEREKFNRLVSALADEWSTPGDDNAKLQASLRYVPLLNWRAIHVVAFHGLHCHFLTALRSAEMQPLAAI